MTEKMNYVDMIEQFLKENGASTNAEISAALGIKSSQTGRALANLSKADGAEFGEDRKWHATGNKRDYVTKKMTPERKWERLKEIVGGADKWRMVKVQKQSRAVANAVEWWVRSGKLYRQKNNKGEVWFSFKPFPELPKYEPPKPKPEKFHVRGANLGDMPDWLKAELAPPPKLVAGKASPQDAGGIIPQSARCNKL